MTAHLDDLGNTVTLTAIPARIVSLVPSLTEAMALSTSGVLIAATDWCSHPADLDVARIGGTKNPDVSAIAAMAPDLVVANAEENRREDLDSLRDAGLAVWVTDIRTVDQAFASMARLLEAIGATTTEWLDAARREWGDLPAVPDDERRRAIIPIWRRPWMHVGSDTYAGDVLRRLGIDNALAEAAERYPRIPLEELPAHELVVLPDEPYAFTPDDGPGSFAPVPCALVSGRLLTWYGPAMLGASATLLASLQETITGPSEPERP